jgi:hypothetical protein
MANNSEQDKNFKKVKFYQDKILLETELNELQDIQNRRFEEEVYESLGNVIINTNDFLVEKSTGWNISVGMGRAYIQGKVVTNKGGNDTLAIVSPDIYAGDITLKVILIPHNRTYLPEEEGDKGWEYGVGEPTTYRTEESYEVVIAHEGTAIIVGNTTWAIKIPTDSNSYIELSRIVRPNSAIDINDCIVRDTRLNLIKSLSQIVNKTFYMKAEQEYIDLASMESANTLLITPTLDIPDSEAGRDARDRICTDLNVCHPELSTLSTDNSISSVYDINGNKVDILSIVTKDINGETLPEATVNLSGEVANTVYVPIVGASNLILNNSFEEGSTSPDNWVATGIPIYNIDGLNSYDGNDSVEVSFNNLYKSANINIISGNSYRFSAYIKALSGLIYKMRVDWYNSSDIFISSSTEDITVTTDNFVYYESIVQAPINATYLKIVLNGDGNNSTNWFLVDFVSLVHVTEHSQFPIVLHYGYEYTLANLPANFAMADIVSGVSIDMAIQEILGNRYFDGSLPIASDGTNSVDSRLVDLSDGLHNHRHKGIDSVRLEAKDIDLLNPPGITTQTTVEEHIVTVGTGEPDDNNPHGLSAKNIDVNSDEVPYPNAYSSDTLIAKTSIHGQVDVSMADHILEVGTGIPDSDNPHGLDSSDLEHNSETNPDSSFKTIEQALFDRVKDLHGDGIVRGLRIFSENSNYVKITDGYAYINGKRIRVGNSIIIQELLSGSSVNKVFRITGALVNDVAYITYFDNFGYYRWSTQVYSEGGMLKVIINDTNMVYNYNAIDIVSYDNLKWNNNENFEIQLSATYQQINIPSLSTSNDRIDIIALADNGVITLIQGTEDGNRRTPIVPNNNIKIAEVYVNYNGSGTDNITYDDVGDFRYKIDWKNGNGSGSGNIGYNNTVDEGSGVLDNSVWKRLQSLETTINYYKQLFVYAADVGSSLSRMAVETFIDNTNIDSNNSSNVRLDDANIYLGTDDEPLQSLDLVADWRNFGVSGGIGTWVSKSYIAAHTIGINNLLAINNPDFEIGAADPLYWDKVGSPIYSTDGTKSYKGLKAIKVSYGNSYRTNNFITIVANRSYKITSYIKADSINVDCRFKASWYNASQVLISDTTSTISVSNSRYDYYEAVLVAPANSVYVKITLDGDGSNSNNWFWFDSIELMELTNVATVLFFSEDTLNGGNNNIRYYLSNNGSIPSEQVQPNALHTFSTVGSELRVKIEIEATTNDGNQQPRVHSFSLVWGIGQGHNHDGINSTNVLGDIDSSLTILGQFNLSSLDYNLIDVTALITYLLPTEPPKIGEYYSPTEADPVINGPNDMRLNLSNFNFVNNAFIPANAFLLSGSDIIVGAEHHGVTNLSTPIDLNFYVYPADRGYIEITVNGLVLGWVNLTTLWADNSYTTRTQAKLNQIPRTLTEQLDYSGVGIHGVDIIVEERMTYVPIETNKAFPCYQTAKCTFEFNPAEWQNSNGNYGEEELGKIRIAHYTDSGKLTLISETISISIFNDVG